MKTLRERFEQDIHWINEEDTIDQLLFATETWLREHKLDCKDNYCNSDTLDHLLANLQSNANQPSRKDKE